MSYADMFIFMKKKTEQNDDVQVFELQLVTLKRTLP